MKKMLFYGLLAFLSCGRALNGDAQSGASAEGKEVSGLAAGRKLLWEIGRPDNGIGEFALAPDKGDHFVKDGFFIVGRSRTQSDWPYSHPGPADAWAGSRQHTYTILFGLKGAAAGAGSAAGGGDSCRLRFRLIDVGDYDIRLGVEVNGQSYPVFLPKGAGKAIYGDVTKGHAYAFDVAFPAALLKAGGNSIRVTTQSGSWLVYDWIGLEAPAAYVLQPVKPALTLVSSKGLPFLSIAGGREYQAAELSILNSGDSTELALRVAGMADQRIGVAAGEQRVEIRVPAVTTDSMVEVALVGEAARAADTRRASSSGWVSPMAARSAGGKAVAAGRIELQPVRKMTIYILPHSHNDIGYTEIQTNVEKKQLNNLLTGIDYARRTKDYPEGARFVWNLEGLYAADLFLHRMDPQQKKDFFEAVKSGGVALNGMYLNTLTGLCRPEELLQLFSYSTELGRQCQVTVDAAMISDVPGYTWGTVAAMAQAGIKYFSVAPNFFDRIGDILQQWQDKPFYWVSPSGKEKVLVWIPYMGYALSSTLPGLSKDFVASYMEQMKSKGFPYDIAYIRWSGHGDNAVPDLTISDFVKDWSGRYEWPKFVISSTSTAFHAFEQRYGDQLPREQGDWTGYWEDGAGSSAYETAENRASSSRLSQAEVLWAMKAPRGGMPGGGGSGGGEAAGAADTRRGSFWGWGASMPVDSFRAAWQHILLYSEHTWGADMSVTTPLSQKTTEQWAVKKSYATRADSLSRRLVAGALEHGDGVGARAGVGAVPHAIDVYNTNSWPKTGLVLVPARLSGEGDKVKDEAGHVVATQRLSTGELAFVAKAVPPFAAKRYFIAGGKAAGGETVHVDTHSLDNGLLRVVLDEKTGAISGLRSSGIDNDFVDSAAGDRLNDYLFLNGSDLADLQRNGPVRITVKEQGPVLATLLVESGAPGCNKLIREVRLVAGFDWVELTNILDKKPALLNPHQGDWAWANTGGKESLNIGFPFHVRDGAVKLDIPMAVMRPELDQIPGSCKNWLEVGGWADVSNAAFGVTWVTLDAPLVEVGGITATLLGGQTHPEVWRKKIEPTQKLYSWALNNHWETNYRASQEGIITLRYALRAHGVFDPVGATEFSTGLSQPLIVAPAMGIAYGKPLATEGAVGGSLLQLSSASLVVLALRPSTDGAAWIVTLFNPGTQAASTKLLWGLKVGAAHYSDTGETAGAPVASTGEIEVAPQDVVTVRVEK
jgi:alpha-mannosidase